MGAEPLDGDELKLVAVNLKVRRSGDVPVELAQRLLATVERLEALRQAADDAVTALLLAISLEQPGFDWTAERTADAIDTLTKVVLPLGDAGDA